VPQLVRSTNRLAVALDDRPEQLGSLLDNLATTAGAVQSRDRELSASLAGLSQVLRVTPPALRSLDQALPRLERAGHEVAPALPVAPRAFRRSATVIGELDRLAAPSRRGRTVTALRTAFRDLPQLVGNLAATFPATKPVSDCLTSHVLPLFNAKVPDGSLSTGRPVWQDFVHALVGLSSASQDFDGNGHALRYQLGLGGQSLGTLPGSDLLTNAPSTLRSRPLPRSDGKPPPLNADAACSRQPHPDLNTPTR
jgi:phospholipid/cholesterol/gamma-HCH transport system substrate-binding protein